MIGEILLKINETQLQQKSELKRLHKIAENIPKKQTYSALALRLWQEHNCE